MYQVIAKMHKFKNQPVQPYYIAKTYKNIKAAKEFVKKQKNHPDFYFEIKVA